MAGYTVSYSPWTNPYTGTGGQSFYSTTPTQQPVYRRLVLPPHAALFKYPGVEYAVEDSKDEENKEPGMILTSTFRPLLTHT
jgi:hypothetical protein